MDELYSNLENYNEVNIVEELKNENKELKYKLEEYSNTMKQLQTDFDRLHSEHKKLELNFSSLLKTARAEIERKTQLITNLNREKDILVIKSMQNGQINILKNLAHNMNRGVYNKKDNNKNEGDKEFTNLNKNKLGVKTETRDVSRMEPHLLSPIESISSIGTTIKSTSSEANLRANNKHSSDIKENILKNVLEQQHKDRQTDKTIPMKVMDRRKSMPVLSNWEEQFSSDEEQVGNLKRHQDYEKKSNKDLPYGRTQKVTEQTGYDSKNKYNERYTDKYNPYADQQTRSRHRPHYRHSPERDRYKSQRGSDNSYRKDIRQRILKSPPLDKYDQNKSRNRKYREKDNDRDYDNYNVNHYSRNKYDSEDRAYSKEPDVKRRRIESTSTDTERYDKFIDRKSFKHSEYSLDVYHDNLTSCQSPDYEQIESSLAQHFVKEIMNTATVQLEDPRIISNKYLLDKSNKGSFITAVGVNVAITPIDRSQWGLEKIEVPEALKEKPSVVKSNDNLLNYIYMDIDEPAQNTSAKEYREDPHTDSEGYTPVAPETPTHIKYNFRQDIDLTKDSQALVKSMKESVLKESSNESDSCGKANDEESKTLSSHYKIPKKSKTDSYKNISHKEQDTKNDIHTDDKSMRKDEKSSSCNSLGSIIDIQNIEHSSNVELNKARRLTPKKDNLAGDLELSDEGSDIMDDIQTAERCDNELKINTPVSTQNKVDKILKDDHTSSTVQDNKHIEKSKQKTSKHKILEIKEERDEVVNKVCKEKKSENIQEAQKTICKVDKILKDDHTSSTVQDNKHIEKCKQQTPKDKILEIREERNEVVNKICKEKKSENIQDAQKTICKVDKILKDDHTSSTVHDNKHTEKSKQKTSKDKILEIREERDEVVNKICKEEKSENIQEAQKAICKVDKILKDYHTSSTVQDNKHIEKCKQKTPKDKILEIREERDEGVNKICKDKKSENIQEAQQTICNDDNLEINPKENDSKIVKEKIPKQIEECKKKSSKKKHEEKKATERLDECEKTKTLSKDTRKREKKKKVSRDDTDKQKNVIVNEEKNTKKLEEIKSSKPKNKFTELFGESSSLITPDDLGIMNYDINTVRNDNYGSLFENTQDAIDLNVSEIQKIQNTEEIASDVVLLPKTTEDKTQIPYAIDNKSVFKMEEKHTAYNIFNNLTPVPIDSESNVVKTVVISSGVQNIVEEKEAKQENLSEHKSINAIAKLANKQLPVELLRAVATSTPYKTQCEISSKLTEESSSKGESLSNADVLLSDTGHSLATDVGGAENNAPDVRIFLKRRRKIRKT